jgi:N-acetyldiaminopimelate deacetylase
MNQLTLDNAKKAAALTGSTFQVDFLCSYDAVVNDAGLVEQLKRACEAEGIIYQEAEIAMTGEDFGFYTTLYPGLLYWLGSDCPHPLHSPRFLPSQKSIDVGVALMWHLIQS